MAPLVEVACATTERVSQAESVLLTKSDANMWCVTGAGPGPGMTLPPQVLIVALCRPLPGVA